jgi:hypothetical protein
LSAPSSNYDDYSAYLNSGAGQDNGGSVQNGQTTQPGVAPTEVTPNSPAPAVQPHLVSQSQT